MFATSSKILSVLFTLLSLEAVRAKNIRVSLGETDYANPNRFTKLGQGPSNELNFAVAEDGRGAGGPMQFTVKLKNVVGPDFVTVNVSHIIPASVVIILV